MAKTQLSDKTVQPLRSMEPCRILKTLHKSKNCTSYLVVVKVPGGQEEISILQVFPAEAVQAYQAAEEALRRTWNPDLIECIKGAGDIRYIFIKNSADELLTWNKISSMSLLDRFGMIMAVVKGLQELAADHILLNGGELKNVLYNPADETASFWDFSCAVIADADTPEEVRCASEEATVKKLAEFAYCTIMGKACAKENAHEKLLLTLCHKLPGEHLHKLLDVFARVFSGNGLPSLSDFVEMLGDTQIYLLESPSMSKARGNRNAYVLAAADFLDKNPLYPYVQEAEDGSRHLHVVLVGRSSMRMAFFSTIFSCAQMLDTQMHIHILAKDAEKFYNQCITEAPLLAETTAITHIPPRPECACELNERITGKDRSGQAVPLACLTFETVSAFPTAEKLKQYNPGCIFLLDEYSDEASRHICKFASDNRKSLLLGICNPEPVQYDYVCKNGCLNVRSFTSTGTGYRRKPLTQSKIYQKALDIHTFYSKGNDQRISRGEVLDQFRDIYNRDSSIRSALAIPYKLHGYGLTGCKNVSEQFAEKVLKDPAKINRLVWLEHRSWQAYLIIRGWTFREADLEKDFIGNQLKHQNKKQKWHACLLGSNDFGTGDLEQWTADDWMTRDIAKLDPLDQLSVKLHRILVAEVKGKVEQQLTECLNNLEGKISDYLFQQVQNAVRRLCVEVSNADIVWERVKKELPDNKPVRDLCEQLQHLINRNRRRIYKVSDRDIIEAIPYLLRDVSVQCVYKLCADRPWDNVAVSMIVEPETLIVLTDEKHTLTRAQQGHIADFLQDRRRMEITLRTDTVNNIHKAEKGAVADITGATAEQVIMLQQHPVLGKLPMIGYSNGKLINPDGKFAQIRFYPAKKSLTVEETMVLTGTKVISENVDIPMHRLKQYREMWKASQTIDGYTNICRFLSNLRTPPLKVYRKGHRWTTTMSPETAQKYGITKLLEDMRRKGIVQYESFQDVSVQQGLICIADKECDLLQKLDEMIQAGTLSANSSFYLKQKRQNLPKWEIKHDSVEFILTVKNPWTKEIGQVEAEQKGLLDLLRTLQSGGIVESFGWNQYQSLVVIAADPHCQGSLNRLLNGYTNSPDEKREQLKPHFVTDDPDAICVLEDMSLKVSCSKTISDGQVNYEFDTSKENKYKQDYRKLKKGLAILAENGLISKDYYIDEVTKPGCVATMEMRFSYTDEACLDCLTKAGNSLEAFAYHTIRQMGIFDDVKLGVTILWNDWKAKDIDTKNEIDLVCTKGTKTYFISCKNTQKVETEFLTEIRYETDRFGLDGTAILLTTVQRQDISEAFFHRARHMGIEIITLPKNAPKGTICENSEQAIQDALTAIVQK